MINLINNIQHNNNIHKLELNNKIIFIKLFNSDNYDLQIKLNYNKLYKLHINCNIDYEIKLDNIPMYTNNEYTINLSNYKNIHIKFKKNNTDIYFDKLYLEEIKYNSNHEKLFLFNDSEYILSDSIKNNIREILNKNSLNLDFYSEIVKPNNYIFEYFIDNNLNKKKYSNKCLLINPNEINNFKDIIINYNYANIFFENIYVINLKNDIFRKEVISKQMSEFNLKYQLFEATNGRETPECQMILNNYLSQPLYKNCHPLEIKLKKKLLKNVGEIGYLFSWKNIIQDATNKYKTIAIFDDDVILHMYFKELIYHYLTYFSFEDYSILNMGSTQYFNPDMEFKKINNKLSYYNSNENTDGSFAVGINSRIYQELIDKINNFNATLDTGCLRDIYIKYNNCYTPYQNLVIAYLGKTGINNKKDMYAYSIKLKWNLEKYNWAIFFDNMIDIILLNNSTIDTPYNYLNETNFTNMSSEYILVIYRTSNININNLITKLINENINSIKTSDYFFGKITKIKSIMEKHDIINNPYRLLEVS